MLQVAYSKTGLRANKADLTHQVYAICRRAQSTSNGHFKLRLTEKLCMKDAATTLQSLIDQGNMLANFSFEASVVADARPDAKQAEHWAQQVASISTELRLKHGVMVCIILGLSTICKPSPATLQHLAPFLHSVDMTSSGYSHEEASSAFTPAHVAALLHCSSPLAHLRIPICAQPDGDAHPYAGSMADIAQLSSLTRLHLSLPDTIGQATELSRIDFGPLSQLKLLQNLTLQSYNSLECCIGVMWGSKQSLRSVTLTAARWSLATYQTLQEMPNLDSLLIKLKHDVDVDAACAIADITANYFLLQLDESADSDGLSALSTRLDRIDRIQTLLAD